MSTELKLRAKQAAEAIDWLLNIIRRDAPQLSGKAMGNAEKCASALRAPLAQQPATPDPVVPDSSEHLRVIASLGAALRRLSFAAQTTGGTDGPDAELQSAIRQAEQALSLGGLWQAMSATGEPVKVAPYNPTEEMRLAMKRIDPALSSDQCRALWSAAWSASPSTHPAPSVPTTSEPVDFPAGAIVNGRTLMDRIEAYPFESEGGDLRMCSDWHELRRCFEHLADYVSPRPAPSVPDDHQIAALVNKVRDIAHMFHDHQSLRERIAIELVPVLKAKEEAS